MTQPINYPNQQNPGYSGITINITNPVLNPTTSYNCATPNNTGYSTNPQQQIDIDKNIYPQKKLPDAYQLPEYSYYPQEKNADTIRQASVSKINEQVAEKEKTATNQTNPNEVKDVNYPPQYYMNNYNYINDNKNAQILPSSQPQIQEDVPKVASNDVENVEQEEDLSSSKEIINALDAKAAEEKNLEKNGKKVRVVALTNEYIMSLENYLNNPNKEIRLMASKEILTRLDEDKERYDDAALNALLNKMLQDPSKLVRIAALSAFASQLASGNDYTIELLQKIQNDPNADKDDVVQAANILLMMSASTELKYVPVKEKQNKSKENKDLEAAQQKIEQLQTQVQKYKEKEIEQILGTQQI